MPDFTTLRAYVAHLMQAEVVPWPQSESWGGLLARIHVTGTIAEIEEAIWEWYLECLPPRYLEGALFAFAEGCEPLMVFWKREGRCFVRPLTWLETREFCRLARIPLPH
jgi:hypothetical protein